MLKLIIITAFIGVQTLLSAQKVGIGTADPKAALDVVSSTAGILPPRMTGAQVLALTVGVDKNSMLVYATSTSGAINKIGYWYYDHTTTSWKPFTPDYTASNGLTLSGTNIKLGGAISEPTTISSLTTANKISFTGTGTDIFNIDANTFSVDATNDRIGIGTAAPAAKLDIVSPSSGSETIRFIQGTNIWALANETSANTGVGTTIPAIVLIDRTNNTRRFAMGNDGTFSLGGALPFSPTIFGNASNNIGIGTTSPSTKLHINSSTTGAVRIVDGNQGAGKIFMSDANGVGTWQPSSSIVINKSSVNAEILGYTPSSTATASTSAPASYTTPSGAVATRTGTYTYGSHSYAAYSLSTGITWYDAYNSARLMGGYLATFTTDAEWQAIETNLLNNTAFDSRAAWIGMVKYSWFAGSAMGGDEVKWITGELPYHDYSSGGTTAVRKIHWFASGEPNNSSGIEGFIHTFAKNSATVTRNSYTSTHPWNDIPANSLTLGFIVEFQQ